MPVTVVNDQAAAAVPDALLDVMARAVEEALTQRDQAGAQVDVTLVDDKTIRDLNRTYRGVDSATDVLSFALREDAPDDEPPVSNGPEDLLLGDVIVSLPRAEEQAREYGHSLEREAAFLVVHGTLHLLGYDHETPEAEREMMALTERVLTPLGLGRPQV